MTATENARLDTTQLEVLAEEIVTVADEIDGLSMVDAKRDAAYKVSIAINAVKVLRKLSA